MYISIVLILIIAQVHYSLGANAKCHDWTEDRVKEVKAKVVDIPIDQAVGTFLNAFVPKWLGDITVCSGQKNEKKESHIQSQALMVVNDGVDTAVPPPTHCKEVEKGVFEESDPSTNAVKKIKYVVYSNGGVVGCISCHTGPEDAENHAVESGGVTVRDDLDWEDPEVQKHINEAKAVLDELKIISQAAPKCTADMFELVP